MEPGFFQKFPLSVGTLPEERMKALSRAVYTQLTEGDDGRERYRS